MRLARVALSICALAACADGTAPDYAAPPLPPASLAVTPVPTGTAGTRLVSRVDADRCVATAAGRQNARTPIVIMPCRAELASQLFTFDGSVIRSARGLCVDAWGGRGRNGDPIVLWRCHGGANQRWTLTPSGELKGINGKCLDLSRGNSAPGTRLVLWSCHGGSNQGWSVDAAPQRTPSTPAPAEVASVRLSEKALSLALGASVQLVATPLAADGTPLAGRTVTWTSSQPAVAALSESGVVSAIGAGVAEVIAVSEGVADTATVSVAAPPRASPATLYGLHMDLTWDGYASRRAAAIARAKAIGTRISRNSFLWHQIEERKGVRDWERTDAVVRELQAAGIEPLMAIYGSPSWANGILASTPDHHLYIPSDPAAFDRWVTDYATFLGDAARRYKGRVKKWELWNEQNEHYFWKPKPDLDRYVQWYRAAYAAIKAADPEAEVAMGAITGLCCNGSVDINGRAFLQGMYARGVRPDIVNVHPYAMKQQAPDATIPWENNFTDIALIRDIMVAEGEDAKPMWVTEWGWATSAVSEEVQAAHVRTSLEMIAARYKYVTVATYFLDYDRAEYSYGLYTADGRLRPSGAQFRDFMQSRQ